MCGVAAAEDARPAACVRSVGNRIRPIKCPPGSNALVDIIAVDFGNPFMACRRRLSRGLEYRAGHV